MPFPPSDKSLGGVLKDTRERLDLVERRLAMGGSGGGGGDGGDAVFAAGLVSSWSGSPSAVPSGWVLCDGRALSRTGYPALYAAIGTTYGAGDGATTFNVPNGKGRFLVGQDGAQVEFDVVGESGGANAHRHDFQFGLFDNQWMPGGSYAGMESIAQANDNDRMGAFRYSTGKFQGAVVGTPATSASALTMNNAVNAGTSGQKKLNREVTTGDTDVPAGTTGLPPYLVQNWIISTGAGSTPPSGAVVPVQLWQEFHLSGGTGSIRPTSGAAIVWDGAVTGTLGATLDAAKRIITLPAAGTYRIVNHLGLAASPGVGVSSNANWGGVNWQPSYTYGNTGAAGVFIVENDFVVTATGATTLRFDTGAPLGVYDWTWLRIEKQEPFFPANALAITRGSAAQRDAIYGVPADDVARASLANRVISWFNTDLGWMESYYAPTGTAGLTARGLQVGAPAGWYPTGAGPRAVWAGVPQVVNAGNYYSGWVAFGSAGAAGNGRSTRNSPLIRQRSGDAPSMETALAGNYRITGRMDWQAGAGVASGSFSYYDGVSAYYDAEKFFALNATWKTILEWAYEDVTLFPLARMYYLSTAGSGTIGTRAQMAMQYIGPPLVTA